MRRAVEAAGLSVRAISSSRVVLFGINIEEALLDGLLGFAIVRENPDGTSYAVPNFLQFAENDTGETPDHSSVENPFQAFLWGDYALSPGAVYRYTVSARYGKPGSLETRASVDIAIATAPESASQGIYFNRGAGESQAYIRSFGNRSPDDVPNGAAYAWLSRGLEEGLLAFIGQADQNGKALRAAVYEFTCDRILQALGAASRAGADVKIVFDCVPNSKNYPAEENINAIAKAGINDLTIKRSNAKIAHNKFIVLLENGKPNAVWTGSTNITEGGLFGQLNVGHALQDEQVAQAYLDYWTQLSGDPDAPTLRAWNDNQAPVSADDPPPRPNSIRAIFSPRPSLDALNWYASLMEQAKTSVFMTDAFAVSKEITKVFETDRDYLRYLLLDKGSAGVETIRRDPNNRVAAGAIVGDGGWHQWLQEHVTGLDGHVQYIHTKFALIDPLSPDPTVIAGSANFSEASTTGNDENMLVIRGNTDVADVYLAEFMRVFSHFRFRALTKRLPGAEQPADGKLYLAESDQWARRFFVSGSPEEKERLLFGGQLASCRRPGRASAGCARGPAR